MGSAELGCYTCRMFLDVVVEREEGKPVNLLAITDTFRNDETRNEKCGAFAISHGRINSHAFISWLIDSGTMEQQKVYPSTAENGYGFQFLGPEADCDLNIKLMRGLIDNCLANHPDCQLARPCSPPSRLLDLGEDQTTPTVRLVPGSDCRNRQWRYLTLSHCWGAVPQDAYWKLTTEREPYYTTNISFHALPKTFQEAITLTKRLGERYLWIDSLCIIQDSRQDWEIEASRMAEVYSGSLCTLSTATDGASSGCFFPRADIQVSPVELNLSRATIRDPADGDNSTKVVVFPCLIGGHHAYPYPDIPVLGRAWTLQERELSIRIIQFTELEFRWKCNTMATTEGDLYKENFSYTYQQLDPVLNPTVASSPTEWQKKPRSALSSPPFSYYVSQKDLKGGYRYWHSLIEDFSKCMITYRSDRLAALQGLTTRHVASFPDRYVAGIWEADICSGLLWEQASKDAPPKRPEPLLFPTWSWLSLEAPVKFGHLETPLSPAPDSLKIRIEVLKESGSWAIRGSGRLRNAGDVLRFADGLLYDTEEDRKRSGADRTVVCLPLEDIPERSRIGGPMGHGLVLLPIESQSNEVPTFKRVGIFWYTFRSRTAFDMVEPTEFRII